MGELPRSIRLFVFADDFSWGINTQATLKQLRAQLRGMDADVLFLAVGSGSQELNFQYRKIYLLHIM